MPTTRLAFALLLCLLAIPPALLAQPAADAGASRPRLPAADWPRSTPAAQGLDPGKLDELVTLIRRGDVPHQHALLIVRHGYLVLEEYFDGWSAGRIHMQQSVSKSFTSALVGIAVGQGAIRGVDEKILGFFPDLEGIQHLDARKRAMTLEDLLTMRSGTDYHERGADSPHFELNSLPRGWDRFYLDRPMVAAPGTTFNYDSGGVILMSALLKARTGLHADAFADRHLFAPLGIEERHWFRNQEGHPHTGGGLDLRPRDMAKFGLLYLRGGKWGDRQVVSGGWVEASLTRHVDWSAKPRGRRVGYGYLWWVLEPDPAGAGRQDVYAAMGFRGQYIFLVPEHDMVVAVTAGTRAYRDERRAIDVLYSHILPSVVRD